MVFPGISERAVRTLSVTVPCVLLCLISNYYDLLVQSQSLTLSKRMKYLNERYTTMTIEGIPLWVIYSKAVLNGILVGSGSYLPTVARSDPSALRKYGVGLTPLLCAQQLAYSGYPAR